MSNFLYLDTETCGLHGPIVIMQYAINDGEIYLHEPWKRPIDDTISLIDSWVNADNQYTIVGFNLAYDWFHICQLYTTLLELRKIADGSVIPEYYIQDYAECEEKAVLGPCVKPWSALDLMLHARKGPYQSTMNRKDIKIKRVPTALAWDVAKELDARIILKDIYFARKSDPTIRWQVEECEEPDPDFKNIVLRFAPSSALKALAYDALGYTKDDILLFMDINLSKKLQPIEYGYAPTAKLAGWPNTYGTWPDVISAHIDHWSFNNRARQYAGDDVKYTRDLHKLFSKDQPTLLQGGDDDSILACAVGAIRWHGYKINVDTLTDLRNQAVTACKESKKHNFDSPAVCKKYLKEVMNTTEQLALRARGKESTGRIILEAISKWVDATVCECCGMDEHCKKCGGEGLVKTNLPHPAATRARQILDYRMAIKEVELYDKLLQAGRFYASFKIIGTLSSRMSGADGLNPQGIKRAKPVRRCFPLADEPLVLCGGDMVSFEVTLADAEYQDPLLRQELLSGKSIHGLFGTYLFPDMTYEQIIATKGLPGEQDLYTRSKNSVFAVLYGGEAYTLETRAGINKEAAENAYNSWVSKYKVWGQSRRKIFNMFCSMRQPGGIGTRVEWHDPNDYVESMFGFKRYFTLENKIVKILFDLANDPPKHWRDSNIKVKRRDRIQTGYGASQSALYAAAFAVQAANMRAAANHVIQSSGATITKGLQRKIWDIQPVGVGDWLVIPMNIHDEIMVPTDKKYVEQVHNTVKEYIDGLKHVVPLLDIEWKNNLHTWADK